MLLKMARDGRVVLDDFAVVIHDPNRAVGAVEQVHRMAPLVGRGGELGLLFAGRAAEVQRRAVGFDE